MAGRNDKGKIVFLSTFVMLIFIILSIQSIQRLRESDKIREKDEQVEAQYDLTLALFKNDGDFLAYELNSSEFYKTGNSKYLQTHDSLLARFQGLFEVFDESEASEDNIASNLKQYDSIFKLMVEKIKIRGYRDYGLEGKMRDKAHEIEKKKLIPEVAYLQLRRNEKDYLLRSDSIYIHNFDDLIEKNSNASSRSALQEYSASLHELARLSDAIGLETHTNLKGNLNSSSDKLLSEIQRRDAAIDQTIDSIHRNGIILFIIGMIGSTIICFTLIVIIIKRP